MNKRRFFLRRKRPVWIPGNNVQILNNGAAVFPEMLRAIEQAQETIHLETYIIESDRTGWRFAEALSKKAREGLAVKLIYDGLGSFGASTDLFLSMEKAGVELFQYHPIALWKGLRWLKKRDHRKTLIVDGRIGFTGGINIGDEYADPAEGGGGWRDTHIKVEGPAVRILQKIFLSTWIKNKKNRSNTSPAYYPDLPPTGDLSLAVVASNGLRGRNQIRRAYFDAIDQAKERICITNAYFIPLPRLIRALNRACRRGVQVSILLPRKSDHFFIDYASRAFHPMLLKWGAQIFEWEGPVLHAKTAVIDGRWSTIGSFNMDPFSFFYNMDLNVIVKGAAFGKEMERIFREDLQNSREVSPAEWRRRNPLRRFLENIFYYLLAWI